MENIRFIIRKKLTKILKENGYESHFEQSDDDAMKNAAYRRFLQDLEAEKGTIKNFKYPSKKEKEDLLKGLKDANLDLPSDEELTKQAKKNLEKNLQGDDSVEVKRNMEKMWGPGSYNESEEVNTTPEPNIIIKAEKEIAHNPNFKGIRIKASRDGVKLYDILKTLYNFKDQEYLNDAFEQKNVSAWVKQGTRYLPLGYIGKETYKKFKSQQTNSKTTNEDKGTDNPTKEEYKQYLIDSIKELTLFVEKIIEKLKSGELNKKQAHAMEGVLSRKESNKIELIKTLKDKFGVDYDKLNEMGGSVEMAPLSNRFNIEEDAQKDPWAETILQQLGGRKFIAMTGAKNFVKSDKDKYIIFQIGRNKTSANFVKIALNSMDLYDMEFIQMRAGNKKILKAYNGVYNDMLQDIFTEFTGMYTHLEENEQPNQKEDTESKYNELIDRYYKVYKETIGKEYEEYFSRKLFNLFDSYEKKFGKKHPLDNAEKSIKENESVSEEIKFKKINQFGNETLYQASNGSITIPFSITRIKDKIGTLLQLDISKIGRFETYKMDEIKNKIKNLFKTDKVNLQESTANAIYKKSLKDTYWKEILNKFPKYNSDKEEATKATDYITKNIKGKYSKDIPKKDWERIEKTIKSKVQDGITESVIRNLIKKIIKEGVGKYSDEVTAKDEKRIKDIITKANGDKATERALALRMARSITDVHKAIRRVNAAEEQGLSYLADIFMMRAKELDPWYGI